MKVKKQYLISFIILVILCSALFFLTHFSAASILSTEGYFVTGSGVEDVLLSEKKTANSKNIDLNKVSYNDSFYSNLNNLYVGEEKKVQVNSIYPIFSNNGKALVILNSNSSLINDKFEFFETYENSTVTGGKLYNYGDSEQADYENYLFLQLSNLTYVNLYEIKLETLTNEFIIPVNSIINFNEGYLKYYSYDSDGVLVYSIVDGIDLTSVVTMGDDYFSYKHLLLKFDKISDEEETADDIGTTDPDQKEDYIIEGSDNNIYAGSGGSSSSEYVYVKPKVTADNFVANVYSTTSKIHISDPSGVIVGGINFQFKIGDKIFIRKTFINSGKIEITGLVPNTEFTIVGSYKYYNEENKKIEATFFEQKITTLGVDQLDPIDLEYVNGAVYSNKLEVNDIRISSDLSSETIKGVNKGTIVINDDVYSLSSANVQNLINGKTVTYTSPAKITSNQTIYYSFKLLDAYGNEIKVNQSSGVSRTSKESPTATVKIISTAVNSTSLSITLKNEDNVNINSYRYLVYSKDGVIVYEDNLSSKKTTEEITLNSLDPNSTYTVKVVGTFDIEDGNGVVKDAEIGEGKFTSLPLSSLGYVRAISEVNELTYNSVTISTHIDLDNVSSILLELLSSMTINLTDGDGNVIYTSKYTGSDLEAIKIGEDFVITVNNLSSVTTYKVTFSSTVTQGTVTENISVLDSLKSIKTKRRSASIEIQNQFVNSEMIDYDVRVVDLDNAIESDRVLLEVRTLAGKLVSMDSLEINGDYERKSYTKLDADQTYVFTYKAEEYNIGYDNSTYESDYVLKTINIVTSEGISGSLQLTQLLRQIDGTNLFNIEDYDRIRKEGYIGTKEYDIKNNIVTFGAKNGYVNFSYYMPEAYQKKITVSFYARYNSSSPNKAEVYIGKSTGQNKDYQLKNINDSWQYFSFTFTTTTYYVGFVINETANQNKKTIVDFKDIMIQYEDSNGLALTDSDVSVSSTGYKFTDAVMISGDSNVPNNPDNQNNTVGNSGNGYAKIVNLSTGKTTGFSYTGSSQSYTVPNDGEYKIELWGAAGGSSLLDGGTRSPVYIYRCYTGHCSGGNGAYTSGQITLKKGEVLYFYVGGKGADGVKRITSLGGYNGGGDGDHDNQDDETSGGGGGATDVRVVGGEWNDSASLQSRIMVAAGGGGGSDTQYGGDGGALFSKTRRYSSGATQTSGYAFGIGQNGVRRFSNVDVAGGGGGWYGGYASNSNNSNAQPGSGGSSYISGYTGCVAYGKSVSQSESGVYSEYSEKEEYLGTININVNDKNDEIPNDDYYIRIYLKGELVSTYNYSLIDNKAENLEKYYEFKKNKNYTVVLSVKIRDRFYDLDSIEFDTNTEIRAIYTVDDFFNMHPNGKYIVLNDLDFSYINTTYSSYFYGEIDFLGHSITWNVLNRPSRIFYQLMASSKISNLVMNVNIDNTSNRDWFYGLTERARGTIDNLMINVLTSTYQPNYVFTLVAYVNYGTISNFVVHTIAAPSAKDCFGLIAWSNQGVIRNGYVYGENIKAYYENADRSRKDVGVIAGETSTNSRIENVFSLISVEKDSSLASEVSVGNLIGYSGTGVLQNAYSSESSDTVNTNPLNLDPNIGNVGNINAKNVFYSSDKTYNSSYSTKISKLALYDSDFQNKVLNSYDGFDIDPYVSLGYFPQVKMNDCMPNQEWIDLPTVTDTDLVDVTSSEEVSNDGETAVITINVNNPGAEKITKVAIQNINTVQVVNQVDSYGKSVVTLKLADPVKYVSKYYIRSLTIQGSLGFEYEKTYDQYERAIDISMYYPIYNLTDWLQINQNASQNYILKSDLDFKSATISKYIISNTFSGVFNGNGRTIKNINISSSNALFNNLKGTIKNLYVKNYTKENATGYGGLVYQASGNAVFDNVHMTNVMVAGTQNIGGLVGYGTYVTIRNCSVTGFSNITASELEDVRIGGLAGNLNNSLITNSYVQDVNINITDSLSTYGTGGLVGQMDSGSIQNCYATGSIKTNSVYAGGIAGYGSIIINDVWSKVDIYSELDYVGGIIGRKTSDNISNTLVMGSVYSNYSGINIHRTCGNSLTTVQSNYAWEDQLYYGYITGNTSSEILLSTEQLMDKNTYYDLLGFDDEFDYSGVEDKILPKLFNSDTGELLPNQKDVKYDTEDFNVSDVTVNPTVNNATIRLVIDNPNNVNITGVKFDYLNIVDTPTIGTINGQTIIQLKVTPKRYYDNYTLTGVTYSDGSGGADKVYDKLVRIELQFYKSISSYTDWQSISKTTTENYRLDADISFASANNINYNVSIGRLEGNNHKISDVNLTFSSVNNAFIKKITTILNDITFDNITINSSASGNYVNIIKMDYADMENVAFQNITINASKASYVAPIGRYRGLDMRDVSIYKNKITGASYVGGLISHALNYDTTYISADDCTIYGSGSYVGGIIGIKDYCDPCTNFYYTATNMNVTGKTYVGGIFGYGGSNYSTISDSTITGISGGDYIGGFSGRSNVRYGNTLEVNNCNIIANGNTRVGGMFGWCYDVTSAYITNTTITQNGSNKSNVGGFSGQVDGYSIQRVGVRDCTITNAGSNTGGLIGYSSSSSIYYTYVYNTEINGVTKVGGMIGEAKTARVYYNLTNAKITGSGSNVGGIYGSLDNLDTDNSSYSNIGRDIILANTFITGGNYVGGLAGYVPSEIPTKFFYDIILVYNLTCTTSDGRFGPITAYDSSFTTNLPRIKVYEKSKLNNKVVSTYDIYSAMTSTSYATATNLKTQSYYTGIGYSTSYFDFSGLSSGYYPYIKNNSWQGKILINLPTSAVTYSATLTADVAGSSYQHELPTYDIYSSGVNTLNIEFEDIDQFTTFEIYEDDVKVIEQEVNSRTFTFNYNYTSSLKVVVTDGRNTKMTTYTCDDFINKVSTYDKSYAYIYNNKLKGNSTTFTDNVIHIYKDKVLTEDYKVYDLSKEKYIITNGDFKVSLLDEAVPLYEFDQDDTIIDTYYNYSVIHKGSSDVIYDKQLFIKNGNIEIVDSLLENNKNSIIIDSYSKKDYVTTLGNDGVIYNLKSEITVPSNFSNKNIKYMSNNIESNSSAVVVMYDTGKVVVFDYRNGKVLNEDKATEDISIIDYFVSNFSLKSSLLVDSSASSYNDSLELKELLESDPITTDSRGDYVKAETSSDNDDKLVSSSSSRVKNYVSYYNAVTNNYDIIDVNSLIVDGKEDTVTENDKIYTSANLVNYYMQESILEKTFGNLNVLAVFITILIGIIFAMIMWIKNIKMLKISEDK